MWKTYSGCLKDPYSIHLNLYNTKTKIGYCLGCGSILSSGESDVPLTYHDLAQVLAKAEQFSEYILHHKNLANHLKEFIEYAVKEQMKGKNA